MTRGDVEEYDARAVKPEDNGLKGPDRSAGVAPFPKIVQRPLRAQPGMNVSQMHYAKRGIITPAMEYVAERENLGRERLKEYSLDGQDWGAAITDYVTPERSEEHTSDLQSLIRILSSDLYLKKNNPSTNKQTTHFIHQ